MGQCSDIESIGAWIHWKLNLFVYGFIVGYWMHSYMDKLDYINISLYRNMYVNAHNQNISILCQAKLIDIIISKINIQINL